MATSTNLQTISSDMKNLRKWIKEVPKERLPVAKSLFEELVFMQNTLVTLKKQVNEEGPVSMFKQGKPEFLREHPALKAYNTTIQRYGTLYKQLIELLPPVEKVDDKDELLEFLKGD